MYLSSLSPVLNEVLSYSDDKSIPYLHTTEASALKRFFQEKVVQHLLFKKRTLIVIPDGMSSTVPAKLLANTKLAHYSLHLTSKAKLSATQIKRLQKLASLQEVPARSQFPSLIKQREKIESRLQNSLQSIHTPAEKSPSLKSMILEEVDRPEDYISPAIQRALRPISLGHETLSLIHRMQQGYQTYYAFIDAQDILLEEAFRDHDHIAYAQDQLISMKKTLAEILIAFNDAIEKIRNAISQKVSVEITAWKKIKKELQEAISEHQTLNSKTLREEVSKKIFHQNAEFQFLKLQYTRQPQMYWEEARILLEAIDQFIKDPQEQFENCFRQHIKQISLYALPHSDLPDIIAKTNSILRAINDVSFLNIEVPKRHFHISELLATLQSAVHLVNLAYEAMMDAGYCHYRELAIRAGLSPDLRTTLTQLKNTTWRDAIKYFASQSQIKKFYNPNINQIRDDYQRFQKVAAKVENSSAIEIHNTWCKIRDASKIALKNTHRDIYKSIWKDTVYSNNSLELLDSLGENLLSFCPLCSIHESEFLQLIDEKDFLFDNIIFLELRSIQSAVLRSLPLTPKDLLILSSYDIADLGGDHLIKKMLSTDMPLPSQSLQSISNSSEKYINAVSIAGHLIDIIDTASIFKWKNQLIISFVDEKVNDRLIEYLNIPPHHFMYRSTLEIGHLVEALLSDRQKILIGENGLFNDRMTNDILWQLQLKQKLSEIEIPTLSIDTSDLFTDKQEAFLNIESKLQKRVGPTVIDMSGGKQLTAAL